MNISGINRVIEEDISIGAFPGAVMCIYRDNEPLIIEAYGNRMITPQKLPMHKETLFDLASLTKPISTATSVMILKDRGIIDLDKDLSNYLPDFDRSGVSIFHLLTHTSGIPAWKALYLIDTDAKDIDQYRKNVVKYLSEMQWEYEKGTKVVYSCLGYILLGEMVRAVTGLGLEEFALNNIFKPLNMLHTFYNPPEERRLECAATEDSNSFEKRMTNYSSYRWREGVVVGEVHDENANSLGGVAGNAGLFSKASDLARFCRMIINGGEDILSSESVKMMSTLLTKELDGSRGIGWIILNGGVLYHTGFTGTAIWIDVKKRSAGILLTNRVHPDATKEGVGLVREKFYAEFRSQIDG
ncbi:serine hydrolase [Candidatus Poribacteria bacterium]|nr:serine hydrolase [Candidatus Poribacteria bacterium]